MESNKKVEVNTPYGGKLVNLLVEGEEREDLARRAGEGPTLQMTPRVLCDLEMLANGGFSPLDRFLSKADYDSVLNNMRLANGMLWAIPITLPVAKLEGIKEGQEIALRNANNNLIAWMRVDEIYEADPHVEAAKGLGCSDEEHPTYREMLSWGKYRLSGPMKILEMPKYVDFPELRRTPAEVREVLEDMGNPNVVAFQTRNPMHRAHEELTKRAARDSGANLLIHPVVGMTKPGDVDHYTRVRIYKALVDAYYEPNTTVLSLLPLAMRMAGPYEVILHAIIRRNYGCNHLIVGRDHAGPGKNSKGQGFYDPAAARDMLKKHGPEIGMKCLPYEEMVYLADQDRYEQITEVPKNSKVFSISGTQVRDNYLAKGKLLPSWFTRKETAEILGGAYPARHKQGFCIWFTGLPSAGKSTIADILTVLLMEHGRQITVLDGDVVRTHLSKGLGFSKEDRDTNILRIGYVAGEIVRHHGAVICAAVSPFRETRNRVRAMMRKDAFIETYVATPAEICETRDVKGFYAKARAGVIKGFTGVDDPYEAPFNPEITLQTGGVTPEHNARLIMEYLVNQGFLLSDTSEIVKEDRELQAV